jgi:methylated-DNA-[protein]-cysteine S-methyltransferase
VAEAIGKPKAARAVGQALGSNPLPIILPCHRVIASDGSLGGYAGGLPIKRKLLKIEGAQLV